MRPFDYVRPTSIADAVAAASEPGAHYLAGGTNLVDLMKGGTVVPDRLVDLGAVSGLDAIELAPDGGTRIGALVGNAALAESAEFARRYPAVIEALLSGASPQLRNAATMGGNVLQRTRCAYFCDLHGACNLRESGSGCDARSGENAGHAVLGWSEHCIATHPSDLCVPLAALGATVGVVGQSGRREVTLDTLHRAPDGAGGGGAALEQGELIVAVRRPAGAAAFASHSRYLKVRERTSYAFALVSAAVGLRLDGERVTDARIALGGVAFGPWRAREAEDVLRGRPIGRDAFAEAAAVGLRDARPSGANAHKIELARRVVVAVLTRASGGRPDGMPALPASPFARQVEGA